jgi:chloramphenicol 3-O phosphotransferase
MRKVVLLNGPSSSGKSTLASVLQVLIKGTTGEEYDIVSIDDFLEMTTDKTIYEDDVFRISLEMCEKSRDLLNSMKGVIIDHVITSERIFKQFLEYLQTFDIKLIQVTCPLHELRRREEQRKNRCLGSAESSYQYLFPKEGYHLTVDTFIFSAEECSLKILDAMR